MKLTIVCLFTHLLFCGTLMAQYITPYPDIPRVDVHTHIGENDTAIANYLKLHDELVDESQVDMAIWVNLGSSRNSLVDLELVKKLSEGRIVCAIADYRAHDGLAYTPDEIAQYQQQGYVGYKIWSGPWYRGLDKMEDGYPYIDNPAHKPTFSKMEAIGFPGASVHIADPNGPWGARTPWLADPIEYWKEINAWHKVLERHPNLTVVAAHGNWLMCQDAQIDYLRYMFSTFPNLYIDLGATFQYYRLVNTDNLRSLMIEWADRILYATDIGAWKDPEETEKRKKQYLNTFEILETDHLVKGSFFSSQPIQGLNLPEDVLKKIYYKNAARVYPKVKEQLEKLGYL